MNFLYQLGICLFDSFFQFFPCWRKEFFLVCKITKNMPKSLHLFYGKNNHYGLILNRQAMTVMALLTRTTNDSNDRYSNDSFFKEKEKG